MALFKRAKDDPASRQRQAIADFWAWWAGEGRAVATRWLVEPSPAHDSGPALADLLGPPVGAVHPDLAWEVGPGSPSRHLLTVTAAGVDELRSTARRWRLAAPPADPEWAYADTRQPTPAAADGAGLVLDGHEYVLADVCVDARVRGAEVDVSVHHPHFADLAEDQRAAVAFLLLDQVLGEEAVEIWLGAVDTSPVPPLDPVPLTGLRAVVRDLAAEHTDPDGRPGFALLQGQAPDGRPVLALARVPLRPATAPHLDTYAGVAVPYTDLTPEGLPGPGSLDRLRALEDHVSERLGGSGEIVAVQSHAGLRVLHTYLDGTTPAAEQVRVAVRGWDQGRVHIEVRPDPAWSAVRHLRG